jgi:hypothetical protein
MTSNYCHSNESFGAQDNLSTGVVVCASSLLDGWTVSSADSFDADEYYWHSRLAAVYDDTRDFPSMKDDSRCEHVSAMKTV